MQYSFLVKDLTNSLAKISELSAFYQIIREIKMFDRLSKLRNITVIAPTNSAYQVNEIIMHNTQKCFSKYI